VDQLASTNTPSLYDSLPRKAEYGAMEDFTREIGAELGLTPAQAQAALWMGAAKRTGVDVSSQFTFQQAFKNRAAERAKKEGITADEVIHRFITDPENGLLTAAPPLPAYDRRDDETRPDAIGRILLGN